MPVETSTPNRGYPLPHEDNDLVDDVARLVIALMGVDIDVANLLAAVATKAAAVHGHVITDTTGLQSALNAKQDADERGVANGFASLDAGGKVPAAQLPAALFGALSYQTTWNASTNTPTIPAASADNKGYFYKVATAGTTNVSGITDWQVGDWIVSNGASWDKVDNTDQVVSVAGLNGIIAAAALKTALAIAIADVTGLQTALNAKADAARSIGVGGLATGGGNLSADRTITVPKSTTPQAIAGSDDTTAMTPLTTSAAVAAHQAAAKAWVNFNGSGTVAIRDSFNVTSITDHGVGDWTANLSFSFPNANYAVGMACRVGTGWSDTSGVAAIRGHSQFPQTANSMRMIGFYSDPSGQGRLDFEQVTAIFFGD
jgi:hypothetical protein